MITQVTRIINKINSGAGNAGTVAPSDDHTDGTWSETDMYVGEQLINTADDIIYVRTDNGIRNVKLKVDSTTDVFVASVTLSTDDIRKLNTTPIQIVAADTDGRPYEVISATAHLIFNTSAWSSKKLMIGCDSTKIAQLTEGDALKSTVDRYVRFIQGISVGASTDTQVIPGQPIYIWADGSDPSGGDSEMEISITYRALNI